MDRRWWVNFVAALGAASLMGAGLGWLLPLSPARGGIDGLSAAYQAEYTVMVGAAYGLDNNWDAAQARLGRLAQPDPAGYVLELTERYINEGRRPEDIRHLARLAARYGYITPAMQPYLPAGAAP